MPAVLFSCCGVGGWGNGYWEGVVAEFGLVGPSVKGDHISNKKTKRIFRQKTLRGAWPRLFFSHNPARQSKSTNAILVIFFTFTLLEIVIHLEMIHPPPQEKRRPETFTDLILPVPEQPGRSVQDLLSDKMRIQQMAPEDAPKCEKCGQKGEAPIEVFSEVVSPPRNLVLPLIRFAFENGALQKKKTPVTLTPVVRVGEFSYEFFLAVVHQGATADSGHYTVRGRRSEHADQNRLFCFDDSQVKPSSWEEVDGLGVSEKLKDETPYVLFYRCQQAPACEEVVLPSDYVRRLQDQDRREKELLS